MAISFNPLSGQFDIVGTGGGGGGSGTVTSVDATVPGVLSVSGNPITTSGTLAITYSGTALPVANGGTNSTTTLNNNRVIQSSSGKIQEAAAITASRALISDANGIPVHATTTSTEIGYVNGVTSAIQTQLGTKAPTSAPTFTTSITFGNYRVDPSFHDFGNSGSAITLDLSQASVVKTTFNNATPAITLSNGQAGAMYILMLAQDGTGSRIPSFVTTINWGVNGVPTFSTGASKIDFVHLFTPDGSTFYGFSYILGY